MYGDTLYWFFSTIAQTYGAVVGILGFLMVFRLQNMRQIRSELRERQLKRMIMIFGDEAGCWPPRQMIHNYKNRDSSAEQNYRKKLNPTDRKILWYDMTVMERADEYADRIINSFIPFFAYHLFIIIGSFAAIYVIPIGKCWARTNLPSLNTSLLIAITMILISVFIISIKQIWPFVLDLLKGLEEIWKKEIPVTEEGGE